MIATRTKKEPLAEALEYDLIAEIYSSYEMHPLWLKYKHCIKLPEKDGERVAFYGNDADAGYLQLKHFIEDFEDSMHKYESPIQFDRIAFVTTD